MILTNQEVWEIISWLEGVGLAVKEHKAEVVLITTRGKQTLMKIRFGEHTIHSQSALKYSGVTIDQSHIDSLATKAFGVITLLPKILPNIG